MRKTKTFTGQDSHRFCHLANLIAVEKSRVKLTIKIKSQCGDLPIQNIGPIHEDFFPNIEMIIIV